MIWFAVACGGALGAMARLALTELVKASVGNNFPYATLSANVLGSFVIGLLWVWLVELNWGSAYYRYFAIVGFLGAFTTFSSFSLESIVLLQEQRLWAFFSYIGLSVMSCLAATLAGIWCAKQF